jgi:hypothetical protein
VERGEERGDTAEKQATGMVRADCRWNMILAKDEINQERKESSVHSGDRVLKSDLLSTHLGPKSVVARFEKSADEREEEG